MERQGRYYGTLSRLKAEEGPVVRRSSLARLSDTHMRTAEMITGAISKTHESISSEQSPLPKHTLRKPARNIFQGGELFKDSPLSEYYWAKEEDPDSSVMLLNGKAPRLAPTFKASFDPISRPSDSNFPRFSLLSDSMSSSEGATETSPLAPYTKAFLTPGAQHVRYRNKQMNNSSGRTGVRKLKVMEGKVTRNILPAIREIRPSNRDSGPLLAREDFHHAQRKHRLRTPSSISKRHPPADFTEQREQQELETSIQELDELLSRIRKPVLRSISVARESPVNQTRHSPSRRYA